MDDLLIRQQNKGSDVVIMEKKLYLEKMNRVLDDVQRFKPDHTSGNNRYQNTNFYSYMVSYPKTCITSWNQSKHKCPFCGRLLKIYRSRVQLRPISCIRSSKYHKTARWLVEILALVWRQITPFCLRFIRAIKFARQHLSEFRQDVHSWCCLFLQKHLFVKQLIFHVILFLHTTFVYSFPLRTLRTLLFYVPRTFILSI